MGSTGVSESNMMQYLGIIEHRTNQLLQALLQRQQALGDSLDERAGLSASGGGPLLAEGTSVSVIGQGPAAPAGTIAIHVDPPLIGDEDDSGEESEDEEERPLSRDELKAKTLRGITKRKTRQPQKQAPVSARSNNKR